MIKFISFIVTNIALLCTGCAAPMTEVVATRQSKTIDQNSFEEGNKVWVTYQEKIGTMTTRRGFVIDTDDDSVKLDVGKKRPIDIEYRWIQAVRRPGKDRWYLGVSAGTFTAIENLGQELLGRRFTGPGLFLRYAPYLNGDIEGNVSVGGKSVGSPSWISISGTGHFYTKIPRTYFLLGLGYVSAESTDELSGPYGGRLYYNPRKSLARFRFGFGFTTAISRRFNLRAEADILGEGLLIYLESEIQ